MWRKGNPHTLLVGMYIGAATMEVPPKLRIELLYDLAVHTSGYMHLCVHCNIIHNRQDRKQPSVHRQMNGFRNCDMYIYGKWFSKNNLEIHRNSRSARVRLISMNSPQISSHVNLLLAVGTRTLIHALATTYARIGIPTSSHCLLLSQTLKFMFLINRA